MKLKDAKIADILATEEFYKNINSVIKNDRIARKKANNILLRHVMDRLEERGVLEPEQMTQLYAEVMDRKLQGYSSTERKYILEVGEYAFNKTVKDLLDEEKEDSSNGNN